MKNISPLFIWAIVLIIGCTKPSTEYAQLYRDYQLIEVPIELKKGFGPFEPLFGILTRRATRSGSIWSKMQVPITGIPTEWPETTVKQLPLDVGQQLFQNYQKGTISEQEYLGKQAEKPAKTLPRSFHMDFLKCFSHVVFRLNNQGQLEYKIDTNNDWDFSNDSLFWAHPYTPHSPLDSLLTFAHAISFEALLEEGIESIQLPLIILQHPRGALMYNFPQYAQADFSGNTLAISSGFTNPIFEEEAHILSKGKDTPSAAESIGIGEFLSIKGNIFQNRGIDYYRKKLILQRMPDDSILHSPQIGFHVPQFSGKEFTRRNFIHSDSLKGKYTYLKFWGTWCRPCLKELPDLKEVYKRMDPAKISFLGIADDDSTDLARMLYQKPIPWNQLLSTNANPLTSTFQISAFPSSFLIDPGGVIVAKNISTEELLEFERGYFLQPVETSF